jgi:hypothetical protein
MNRTNVHPRKGTSRVIATAAAAIAIALIACAARAERQTPCASGALKVGDLGFSRLDGTNRFTSRAHSMNGKLTMTREWSFFSEPRIGDVASDGPAAGRLRDGDVLTAIDGALITTREGGRRFGDVKPGMPVTLTVRRAGRDLDVRIVPGAVCPEEALGGTPGPVSPRAPSNSFSWTWPTPAVTPTPPTPGIAPPAPTPPLEPTPEVPATPAPQPVAPLRALPRGWSGFGLTCHECGGEQGEGGGSPVWEFGTLPEIYYVDPGGPAGRAGLQIGDVLTHIDNISLLTEDGGRRFGALAPGQRVRWTYLRGGTSRTAWVTTVARPEERMVPLDQVSGLLRSLREGKDGLRRNKADLERLARELARLDASSAESGVSGRRLRYAGSVGGSEVEVRGLGNVVVDDSGDEIVITTRDAVIHIRPSAKSVSTTPRPK